jgi:hypothetical protein
MRVVEDRCRWSQGPCTGHIVNVAVALYEPPGLANLELQLDYLDTHACTRQPVRYVPSFLSRKAPHTIAPQEGLQPQRLAAHSQGLGVGGVRRK